MSDPPIPRGARQMFGVKDLFTTVNVLGGVFAIYYCIRGEALFASYLDLREAALAGV